MIALLIVGALLWAFVLFALLRRLTEQRGARMLSSSATPKHMLRR